MKIIEALKQIQDLQRKAEDLKAKVQNNCSYLSNEKPVYQDQSEQVKQWIQAHSDILKEILRLRVAIQKTNLNTQVSIKLGEKIVTKSISEWIHRRRDLAKSEGDMWRRLTDRGLREGFIQQSTGDKLQVNIVRCFDPQQRDNNIDLFSSEPITIDSTLEVTNAVTDLMEH